MCPWTFSGSLSSQLPIAICATKEACPVGRHLRGELCCRAPRWRLRTYSVIHAISSPGGFVPRGLGNLPEIRSPAAVDHRVVDHRKRERQFEISPFADLKCRPHVPSKRDSTLSRTHLARRRSRPKSVLQSRALARTG